MHYLIFVPNDHDSSDPYDSEVRPSSQAYLRRFVLTNLRDIPDSLYADGLAAIQLTLAKSVYIVEGADVYWLIEWAPGLVVVRVRPDAPLAAVAMRSPIPSFGGRTPDPDDDPDYDEDTNHQYNLIFDAWDAMFDDDRRELSNFFRAAPERMAAFETAAATLDALGAAHFEAADRAWLEPAQEKIVEWTGLGVRVSTADLKTIPADYR